MAEGDTVFATAARLHAALAGLVLTRTDFRVPRFATADLSGQAVREVLARGKHLLLRTDGAVSVHSHLGMDGAWRLYTPGEQWKGRSFEVRGVLETDRLVAVGHRLRRLEVLRTPSEGEALRHLGPEVLGPDWDAAEAIRKLITSPEREAGEAPRRPVGDGWTRQRLPVRGVLPRRDRPSNTCRSRPGPGGARRSHEVADGAEPCRREA